MYTPRLDSHLDTAKWIINLPNLTTTTMSTRLHNIMITTITIMITNLFSIYFMLGTVLVLNIGFQSILIVFEAGVIIIIFKFKN